MKKGIFVVASSGDYSNGVMMFSTNVPNVISVGALDENDEVLALTSGSNQTTLNSPGDNITSLNDNCEIVYSSGTSQATVLVSGYISLLKDYAIQNKVVLSNKEVMNLLTKIKSGELDFIDVFDFIGN